jgi:hypothetical protein
MTFMAEVTGGSRCVFQKAYSRVVCLNGEKPSQNAGIRAGAAATGEIPDLQAFLARTLAFVRYSGR